MFWENFLVECAKKAKSPAVVAEELGFSNSATTCWKNGSLPRMSSRKKIADYFGISIEELMGTKKEPAGNGGPKDEEMIKLLAEWEMLPEEDKVKSKVYFKGMLDMLKRRDSDGTQ